jgi:hypothetical protein
MGRRGDLTGAGQALAALREAVAELERALREVRAAAAPPA